jgi:protein associated with RNAse G/E
MPPSFDGEVLDYVDLDIDLIVWPGGRLVTLDEDDFAANAAKYKYPEEVQRNVLESVKELKRIISAREFPFENL